MVSFDASQLPRYDISKSYDWNFENAPDPVDVDVPSMNGDWTFCGLSVDSPLGMPAGPLLNGKWILYYASLGFDVLTYKTVRSRYRECYPLPNLQPVVTSQLTGSESQLPSAAQLTPSWAVSFGMPSKEPDIWRQDIEETRNQLPKGKLLSVSVVASVLPDWTTEDLANDYAQCAKWAIESGADCVETNFSCPNVSTCDGQLYQEPEAAGVVTSRVREEIGDVPYLVKIGHVRTEEQAEELLDAIGPHIDGLAMTNSVAATVQSDDGSLLFDGQQRGICGDATRTASIHQTKMFSKLAERRNWNLHLVGVGGASSAEHVQEFLDAGAEAVHIATAAMQNPALALEIKAQPTSG